MQYNAIQRNTMHSKPRLCNGRQYNALQCNAMQYNAILLFCMYLNVATCAAALLLLSRVPQASRLSQQLCWASLHRLTFYACSGFLSSSAAWCCAQAQLFGVAMPVDYSDLEHQQAVWVCIECGRVCYTTGKLYHGQVGFSLDPDTGLQRTTSSFRTRGLVDGQEKNFLRRVETFAGFSCQYMHGHQDCESDHVEYLGTTPVTRC